MGSLPLLAVLLFLFVSVSHGAEPECVLRSPHIELRCDRATSRWTLATLQGLPDLPSDDNHPLTGQAVNTFCVVRIDNTDRKFGSPEGRLALVARSADSVTHSWTVGDIEVLQTLTLTNSPFTRLPASLKVRYWLRNKGTSERRVGLRIVIDTFAGANDNGPFLVPGLPSPPTTETVLRGKDVPDWWVSWDDPVAPFARLGMVFAGPGVVKPDAIAFASRKRLSETSWDFRPDRNRNFRPTPLDPPDSAVSLTWEPIRLRPARSNGIAFHFGLMEAAVTSLPPTDLVLITPLSVSTDAFQLIAEVRNADPNKTLKDAMLSLSLPPAAAFLSSAPEVRFQEIPSNERRVASWRVRLAATPSEQDLVCSLAGRIGTSTAVNRAKRTVRIFASPPPR